MNLIEIALTVLGFAAITGIIYEQIRLDRILAQRPKCCPSCDAWEEANNEG